MIKVTEEVDGTRIIGFEMEREGSFLEVDTAYHYYIGPTIGENTPAVRLTMDTGLGGCIYLKPDEVDKLIEVLQNTKNKL